MRLLLDRDANIEAVDKGSGRTPLLWATIHDHKAILRLLIDSGANVEVGRQDSWPDTADSVLR